MKRNDFLEIKHLDEKTLLGKVVALRGEIDELVLDKNMSKLKDFKAISKKKKDIAQILTVVKQKQLLAVLEAKDQGQRDDETKGQSEAEIKKGESV